MEHVDDPAFMSEHAFEEACCLLLRQSRQVDLAGMSMRLGEEVCLSLLIIT